MSKAQAARLKKGVPDELTEPGPLKWALFTWNGDRQPILVGRPSSFTAACFEYEHPEYCDGAAGLALKIVPSGGVFTLYLRHAFDGGSLKPWAKVMLDQLPSYAEAAGTDVVILSRCPKNRVRKKYWFSVPGASDPGEGVEIVGSGIVPITGRPIDGHTAFSNVIPGLKGLADSGVIIEQAKAPSRRRAKKKPKTTGSAPITKKRTKRLSTQKSRSKKRAQKGEPSKSRQMRTAKKLIEAGFSIGIAWAPNGTSCSCDQPDCGSPGKHPIGRLMPRGFRDASQDLKTVRQWFLQQPQANLFLGLGPEFDLMEIEIDRQHDGLATFKKLVRKYGELPAGPRLKTGGGGKSFLFRHPKGHRLKNFEHKGVECRVSGSRICPPSAHVSSGRYAWLRGRSPWKIPLPELPESWLSFVTKKKRRSRAGTGKVGAGLIMEGRRNIRLTSLAGRLHSQGLDAEQILEQLSRINQKRCEPPLSSEEISRIVDSVSTYAREPNLTDLGNTQRICQRYGGEMKHVSAWGWLVWDGRRWARDEDGAVERFAKETVKGLYAEAATIVDEDKRKATVSWATRSEANSRIKALIDLARTESGIAGIPGVFDCEPWLLNCLNGTLNLRRVKLKKHRPDDLISKLAPVSFDPDAECPLFEKFLDRIFAGKEDLIHYVQRSLGASLTGIVREQVLNIWWGSGANGKTVLRETVLSVLGDYGQAARAETLMVKRGDSIPSDVARLAGARFVGAIEAEEGHRLAESLVKQMTGQDRMLARFMYKDFFEFKPVFKLFLITNHKPSIRGTDHAIWRRIHLLPFEVVIPDDEQDPELIEKLWQESSGILAWLVRGCAAWQKEGLSPPPEVQAATEDYRRTEDILGQFQEESCVDRERENTEATFLYQVYKWWMQRAGEYSISQTRFGTVMAERGYERAKDPKTRRKIYKGVLVKRSVRNAVEAYLDAKR